MDSRLSFCSLFTEYLPTVHKKQNHMFKQNFNLTNKTMPNRAYKEFISNNPNKKGGKI